MLVLLLFAAIYGGFLFLLRRRQLPVIVMRAWFTLTIVVAILVSYVCCGVLYLLHKKANMFSKARFQSYCRIAKTVAFHVIVWPNNQHIRVHMMPGSLSFDALNDAGALCMCHTSFFDSLFFLCVSPIGFSAKSKTYLKSSLRNLPIFGFVLRCCGHFPVYFADESSPSFSVNKEKQGAVAAESEAFLNEGGSLCFFPEGQLNRHPEVLQDFRLGSMKQILQHKLPVVYITCFGNSEIWNASLKGIPGYPTDLYLYISKFEYDPSTTDAVTLAKDFRAEMQGHLDDIIQARAKSGFTPYFTAPKRD